MSGLHLMVATPMEIVLDQPDVSHVRAEDDSGAFGILPHHADFLTVLSNSVLAWRDSAGGEHYVAVRGGILQVRDGRTVEVATREALTGDDLEALETTVVTRFHDEAGVEKTSRSDAVRLQIAAIRQICRYLRPESAPGRGPAQRHGVLAQEQEAP